MPKALLLSDTHIQRPADVLLLEPIVSPFLPEVEMILHAGDLVCSEVLDYLRSLKPTHAVAGNMDMPDVRWVLSGRLVVSLGRYKIGLAHGRGAPEGLARGLRPLFSDVDCIVFGHSHEAFVGEMDGVLMVNPGSPLDRYFAPRNTIGLLEADEKLSVRIIDIGP